MPTVIFGEHPETHQLFVDHSVDVLAAYCNAVRGQDGWGSMPASFGNLIRATAELVDRALVDRVDLFELQAHAHPAVAPRDARIRLDVQL